MKYISVLCSIICLVAFAKPEPDRLNNGKLVPTESTAYNDKPKKHGTGKVAKKKKQGKDKKHNK